MSLEMDWEEKQRPVQTNCALSDGQFIVKGKKTEEFYSVQVRWLKLG